MAQSFIGKPISLISHSDVRYRGILAGIDPAASTIQLSNVYSMGTESRRPAPDFIPPVQEPYQYIIFRASEVKDLAVDDPAPRRSVHDDPAVLGASAPAPAPFPQYTPPYTQPQPDPAPPTPPDTAPAPPVVAPAIPPARPPVRRPNSVHTAAASLETVERALGDLRVAARAHPHPRRPTGIKAGEIKVPATDFDFQGSNARFDKAALAPKRPAEDGDDDRDTTPSDDAADGAYNPRKSFFDSLSLGPSPRPSPAAQNGHPQPRRAGAGRNRREEERERNVATFGEPGGVGLMGPGAYVGGWGGYGRRGGRPRRPEGRPV